MGLCPKPRGLTLLDGETEHEKDSISADILSLRPRSGAQVAPQRCLILPAGKIQYITLFGKLSSLQSKLYLTWGTLQKTGCRKTNLVPVDFITNESLSLRGASPKARDVAISPKLVSRMEAGDNFEYAAHDIVTKFLSPSSITERLPRQASQDAFLAMTMFCLKGYENRNPVSNTKKAVAFLRF